MGFFTDKLYIFAYEAVASPSDDDFAFFRQIQGMNYHIHVNIVEIAFLNQFLPATEVAYLAFILKLASILQLDKFFAGTAMKLICPSNSLIACFW
jgi:hypothetical protein